MEEEEEEQTNRVRQGGRIEKVDGGMEKATREEKKRVRK